MLTWRCSARISAQGGRASSSSSGPRSRGSSSARSPRGRPSSRACASRDARCTSRFLALRGALLSLRRALRWLWTTRPPASTTASFRSASPRPCRRPCACWSQANGSGAARQARLLGLMPRLRALPRLMLTPTLQPQRAPPHPPRRAAVRVMPSATTSAAYQQTRGTSMRPSKTWTRACSRTRSAKLCPTPCLGMNLKRSSCTLTALGRSLRWPTCIGKGLVISACGRGSRRMPL
mmetsp:Transcript_76005/g.191272  ORF Transcript_76005/g.191272 Transcript_76005/m.191272 type:complete len:235 (+) Transcript_76005:3920-4624(+)